MGRAFFVILATLIFITALPDRVYAFGDSGGPGDCCAALSDESLSRVADAYDVPRTVANQILNSVLSEYSDEELRMLQAMPGEACRTQPDGLCDVMPDEFFRFLVEEVQARRSDDALLRQATWEFWRTVVLFVLSILGAALGVLNTWRNVRNKGS